MRIRTRIAGVIFAGLILVMFVGCCDVFDLAEYKAASKNEIETYAVEKDAGNYFLENWEAIAGLAEDAKAAIDEAKDKQSVDAAVTGAKRAIDAVPQKGKVVSPLKSFMNSETIILRTLPSLFSYIFPEKNIPEDVFGDDMDPDDYILTPNDFKDIDVAQVLWVNQRSVSYARGRPFGTLNTEDLYYAVNLTVKGQEHVDAALEKIHRMGFWAWQNNFDYLAEATPEDEKRITSNKFMERNVEGRFIITIEIDLAFRNKLFAIEDFSEIETGTLSLHYVQTLIKQYGMPETGPSIELIAYCSEIQSLGKIIEKIEKLDFAYSVNRDMA